MNDNIQVRITGDASGVAPAIDVAKGSIAGLGAAVEGVNVQMGGFAASMRANFATVSTAANDAAAVVTGAGKRMSIAGDEVKAHWEGLGAVMGKFSGLATGALAVLGGGALFEKAVEATVKLTSENLRLSRALGITTEKASGVHSALEKLGIASDVIVGATQRMTRQLKAHEDAFNKLGIATRDANGHFRDSLDIMTSGLDVLGTLRAGVDRTAASQVMFGRGAGDLTQLMRLNNKEIEEGARVAKELGLVTTEQGVTAMYKYKDSVREVHEVMEGFKVQVGNALLPVLTKLAEWFRGNGAAAINGFVERLTALVDGIRRIVIAFEAIGAELNVFRAMLNGINECVDSFKEQLVVDFETIGKVVRDALTLNWGAIEGDWESGMAKIDAIASSHLTHIAGEAKRTQDAVYALSRAFDNVGKHDDESLGSIFARDRKIMHDGDAVGGARTDDISGKKGPKEKKAPKEKKGASGPSDFDISKQELEKQLLMEKNWGIDEQAYALKFWEEKILTVKKGSKEEYDIQQQIYTLRKAEGKKFAADELATIKDLAKNAEAAAKGDVEVAKLAIQAKIQAAEEGYKAGQISAVKLAQIKRDLNGQLFGLDVDLENKTYGFRMQALENALNIAHLSVEQKRAIDREKEALEKGHQTALTLLNAKGNIERAKQDSAVLDAERQKFKAMADTFGQAIGRMVSMQQGFVSSVKGLWNSLQQAIGSAVAKMVSTWIESLIVRNAASQAMHAKEIIRDAKGAAAGAYRAVVHIPVVGPILAPIAAAAAFAGVMAFSAEQGAGNVPYDNAPFLLHKNEMVLPASLATPLRSMLNSGGAAANSNAPSAANDGQHGPIEVHFHSVMPPKPSEMTAFFKEHHRAVGEGVRHYVRQGGNVSPNRH